MSENAKNYDIPAGLVSGGPTTWEAVKAVWKGDEDSDDFRREYAEQGYESWEAWRDIIIKPLHLDRLSWARYDIPDPLEVVPHFRGGPFQPWHDMYYGGKTMPTFAEIVATPGTDVTSREKFAEIGASGKAIRLIGLLQGDDIFIIEGMHRATSIALAASRGLAFTAPVQLLLAESDVQKFEMIA